MKNIGPAGTGSLIIAHDEAIIKCDVLFQAVADELQHIFFTPYACNFVAYRKYNRIMRVLVLLHLLYLVINLYQNEKFKKP
jgi:hypothetical protein